MCKLGVDALLIVSLEGIMDVHQLEFGFGYMQPLTINMLNLGNALMKQIVSIKAILTPLESEADLGAWSSFDMP